MFNKIKHFSDLIIGQRKVIFNLALNDFRSKYLGSSLGIFWAFIQPTIMILILWFVFEVGFKSMPVEDAPFVLWLIAGIVPWFFISESISNGVNAILDNSFLVKKLVFQVSILPLIKVLSAFFVHLFFIIFLFIIFAIYGYSITIYNIQVIYYAFASFVLVLSISFISSSLTVFLRDVSQFVNMILQFFFYASPIFWSITMIPEKYQFLMKLNPFFYLIEGFRSAFIYHYWFWDKPNLTIYFWLVTLSLFVIGITLFRKLRPHFSDVL